MILKSVAGFHGFEAWRRLHRKYSPRTLARRLRLLMAVVNPGKVKNPSEIQAGLTLWEEKEKVKQRESQFSERLSDQMRMAILTSAMPNNVQDHIFSQASTKEPTYDVTKELILLYASRRAETYGGPTAMDVGNMQDEYEDWQWNEYGYEEHDESDVNGISDAICYNCGGKSHVAPNCPSNSKGMGKGKGGTGFSKGGGKGWSTKGGKGGRGEKGKGKGYQGKGYQGTCFNCGKIGHEAF